MDTRDSYWYLQHVSSARRLILKSGENLVGRHSECNLSLSGFEFLSRHHAKFFVNQENTVSLQQLKSPNGVYVNRHRLEGNNNIILKPDDVISLGVVLQPNQEVRPSYAIFKLKFMGSDEEDIVLISDDENEERSTQKAPSPDLANACNINDVKQEGAEDNNNNDTKAVYNRPTNANATEVRGIHLPKIPEVKQEILSQATKEIENIFGEPDKEFLETVFQVNPYVYKQLNNNNISTTGERIRDGDIIELPEEASTTNNTTHMPSKPNPPSPRSIGSSKTDAVIFDDDNDDYDVNFALSQAVLREMKEEMGEVSDQSREDLENQDDEDFLQQTSWVKTEIATQIDDDEIILIEYDDDELYSKVAGWSSKLLSQVYPLDDDDEYVGSGEPPQLFNEANLGTDSDTPLSELSFFMQNRSKTMRIESSSSEVESEATCSSNKASSQKSMPRKCHVRVETTDISQVPQNNCPNLITNDTEIKSKMRQRSKSVADPSILDANNQLELDVVLELSTLQSAENNVKTPKKQSLLRKRNTPIKDKNKAKELPAESKPKKRSSRLQNRAKSCYIESPLSSPTRQTKDSTENLQQPNNLVAEKTSVTIAERMEINTPTIQPNQIRHETPAKKRSSRLQNRSKSCYMDSPLTSPTSSPKISTKDKNKAKELSAESKPKKRSPRLQNRAKSCYTESPLSSPTRQPKDSTENLQQPNNLAAEKTSVTQLTSPIKNVSPRLQNRSKSCYMETDSTSNTSTTMGQNKQLPEEPAKIVPVPEPEPTITKTVSRRMLNRSMSVYMERPILSTEKSEPSTSKSSLAPLCDNEDILGPKIISAPQLPVGRGKLCGFSAVSSGSKRKCDILKRLRSANYQEQMKKKWHQKPKDQKLECEQIREKRREELKKLAEKPKPVADTNPTAERKRKKTSVPTLGNCNRGEFLTKEVIPPTPKKPKLNISPANPPMRRVTLGSVSQQLNAANLVKSPPTHYTRLPERKEAQVARNQRTCNRVSFAQIGRDFEFAQKTDKQVIKSRHVRFNDNVQIKYIERIGRMKVGFNKDTQKLSLSTYKERREWAQAQGKLGNFSDLIMGNILSWANQWLKLRSADAVAACELLIPIPEEFVSIKQYREIIIPLMKIELLASIERDYELSINTFEVHLKSAAQDDHRNKPRFVLNTTYNRKLEMKFDLFTIYSGKTLKKSFASMPRLPTRISADRYELCFEILQQKDITLEMLKGIKTLTVRPVVDSLRVEMGAFNAMYLMCRSPLAQRILQPTENVLSFDNKLVPPAKYKGFDRLNEQQTDICKLTWLRMVDDSTPSITLIQGPPGTGKSSVISNLTLQCMYGTSNQLLDRKILICAPSNAAVDNITLYLRRARKAMSSAQFEVLRFGKFDKMDMRVRDMTLTHYLSKKRDEKRKRLTAENIMNLTNRQNQLKSEVVELKKFSGQMNYMQQRLNTVERQLRLVTEQLNPPLTQREEHEYSMMYVQRANIVCTTLSSCVKLASFIDYFDACIIDEATQCTEPWTLLPLRFGVRSLVLVGDTNQLPATVLSQRALNFGLGKSMFDRIQRNFDEHLIGKPFVHTKIFKLTMQYRMHPDICRWPNSYFYDNQLINADCTEHLLSPFIPYCVINLNYTQDTNDASNRSISNDEEADFVAKLLVEMDKHMPAERFSYGLITPYSNHCHTLKRLIPTHMKIIPQTVDAYQGQERDVIILSNARTRGVGFLTNYQRLNVAITRPQRCLVICGNFDDLKSVRMWSHLLNDARKRNVYFDLQRSDALDLNESLIRKMLVKPIEDAD